MEEEIKIRRCVHCKKRLLDEKLPICLRCKLEGRDKGGKAVGAAAMTGLVFIMKSVANELLNKNDNVPKQG